MCRLDACHGYMPTNTSHLLQLHTLLHMWLWEPPNGLHNTQPPPASTHVAMYVAATINKKDRASATTHVAGHELVLLHEGLVLTVEVKHLANTLGSHLSLLGAGEGMVVAGHIGHDGALIGLDGGMDVCKDRGAGAGNTASQV